MAKLTLTKKLGILACVCIVFGSLAYNYITAQNSKNPNGPKKYFITFGNEKFIKSRQRIAKEARQTGVFDEIIIYDESFIKTLPQPVIIFIENNPRGYGYWVWKSFVVLRTLEKMNEGDLLLYADAGSTLRKSGKQTLQEYFKMISPDNAYDVISFALEQGCTEKKYTKMDAAAYLNAMSPTYIDSPQYHATFFFIRKTKNTMEMVQKWVEASQHFHLIDDSKSILPNDPSFIEHRHDQSIWSLIRKKSGTLVLDDVYERNRKGKAIIDSRKRE